MNRKKYIRSICAKCGKSLDGKRVVYEIGVGVWEDYPCFCSTCEAAWDLRFMVNKEAKNLENKDNWKKDFTDWLGYKWNPKKPFKGLKIHRTFVYR